MASDYESLKKVAQDYLAARHKFRVHSEQYPELTGNDNLVGRIGEMVAIQFFAKRGRQLIKAKSKVNKGYDLTSLDDTDRVSVKVITSENESGRTTAIKAPWDELVLIELGDNYHVKHVGYLTRLQFEQAIASGYSQGGPTYEPVASRKMLLPTGLIGCYGKVYSGVEVADLL